MKTKFTVKFKNITKVALVVALALLGGRAIAQAPFVGGQTYWINGVGNDLVAPKDTFINFTGAYTANAAYTSSTGLANALTNQGVEPLSVGTITVLLTTGYTGTEAGTINFGLLTGGGYQYMSIQRPIVIKPVSGSSFTITSSTAIGANSALVRFNGGQYITIDGEGTLGQRNITFTMPTGSTANTSRIIDLIAGSSNGNQNITIKNCNLKGLSTSGASASIGTFAGVYLGGTTAGSAPTRPSQYITITNNVIEAVQNPIYMRGKETIANQQDLGLIVRGNTCGGTVQPILGEVSNTTFIGGGANAAGITLIAQSNAVVESNIIRNNLSSQGNFRAIQLSTATSQIALDSNVTINANKIYNLYSSANNSGVYGIRVSLGTHSQDLAINITNNTIANLISRTSGTTLSSLTYTAAISIEDFTANAGVNIYHNSVHLYGDTMNTNTYSACLYTSSNTTGGVKVANNIFVNRMGRSMSSTGATATGCIYIVNSVSHPFSLLSNNIYYVNNTTGSYSFIGYLRKPQPSLLDWKSQTVDQASKTYYPPFIGVDDTTLTINNNTSFIAGNDGISLGGVTTDINGNVRPSTNPSFGAYQFIKNTTNTNYSLFSGSSYLINGVSNWPNGSTSTTAGSFSTLADAITYLNTFGVSSAGTSTAGIPNDVTFTFAPGYTGETVLLPSIINYTNGITSATNVRVVFKTTGGAYNVSPPTDLSIINNQYAVLKMIGARNIVFDGSGGVAGQRNLTFSLPSGLTSALIKVIAITSADSVATRDITIKNCNIIGSSSTSAINTAYGIYQGHYDPSAASQSSLIGGNNNITLYGNYIQAVRTGIYLRGANITNGHNRNILIQKNIIGGDIIRGSSLPMTYIGGVADQAGIYIKGIANVTIDSNIVRNSDSLNSGFRGIDVDYGNETSAIDSSVTISRNTIYNLTTKGTYCVGIRVNLANAENRKILIVNNAIAKIQGTGTTPAASATNPAGISIDASGSVANLNATVYQNTIQMNGTSMVGANASYALYVGNSIKGGMTAQGNLLSNQLGRNSAFNGFAYALYVNNTIANSPFSLVNGGFINSNAYGSNGMNTNNFVIGVNGTNYSQVSAWQSDMGVDFNSYNFSPVFANDSTPVLNPIYAAPLFNGSLRITSVATDIAGNARGSVYACMGALEFTLSYLPLTGNNTYLINGVNNYPTSTGTPPFSFATINSAFSYINANGVDGLSATPQPIKLVIDAGYVGEGDTLITSLKAYQRMNASRIITLTNSPGRVDTITTGSGAAYSVNGSIIRMEGAAYFGIDGSSNGTSTNRNITVMFRPNASTNLASNNLKLIDCTPGERSVNSIFIKNCNLIGNTNGGVINTYAALYTGGVNATPSAPSVVGANNLRFENNFIGGVKFGIYAQGVNTANGMQDNGLAVVRNIIGKDIVGITNQFGGVANASGIYLSSQANAIIDSNVITNNITGSSFGGNRGIDLAATTNFSIDSSISITRNTITKIRHIGSAGAAYGIAINLRTDSMARITVANNAISQIVSPGTASAAAFSTANPFGIFVDATAPINNLGLNIIYNSINLGYGTDLATTNNAISACVAFNTNIRGGVDLRNNILENRLGRTGGTGSSYSIFVGTNSNIFTNCDNNSYYAEAPGVAAGLKGIAIMNATASTPVRYNAYADWTAITKQDSMSIYFSTNFVNDSNLLLNGFQHLVYGWAKPILGYTTDIQGQTRSTLQPTIGADELPIGLFADSVAPRIFSVTKPSSTCSNGPFDIVYRVFERPSSIPAGGDTLYYSLNNGTTQFIVGALSVNSFSRVYRIPAQPINTSIAYWLAVNDNSPQTFRSVYPADGSAESVSTTFSDFPITYGFDLSNQGGWTIQNQGPGGPGTPADGGWQLNSFGSALNPVLTPQTGIKAALFPSGDLASGTLSRLVSPCLDFTNMKVPTVRIWASQNGEALANLDVVQITVSGGFNLWSAPLGQIIRPNSSLTFPQFAQLDVCLSNFVGLNGLKIGIEAISRGGQNIVLDSIVIFDDVLNTAFTPLSATICDYNPLALTLTGSSADYNYTLIDAFTGLPFGDATRGTGNSLAVSAPNPSNPYIGRVDSAYAVVRYDNLKSTCSSYLPDTSKLQIRSFYGGPFLTQGTPFKGSFNAGTLDNNDGVSVNDTATYKINAPSGFTNSDYGTRWTIINAKAQTVTGVPVAMANSTYTAPTGGNNGSIQLRPVLSEVDQLYEVDITFRLLPSNCDSVAVRFIKVTSAPSTSFTSADSTCPGVPIYFTNTTTFLPYTAPISYLWEFGDGTIATTKDANKTYSYNVTPGVYTVKLTAYNNTGVSTTSSKQVTVLAAPFTAFVSGQACGSDSIQFTSISSGADTYIWNNRLGNILTGTSNQQNPKFSFPLADTIYNVTLRATNTLGCYKDSTIGTFSFSKPVAAFNTTSGCLGLNALFTNNTTIAAGVNGRINTFGSEWDFGNGAKGLSNSPTYKFTNSGTYSVTLKVTSNYGCTDSTTRSIVVYDKPLAGFTAGVACQDATVSLTNTTTYAGGGNKVLYRWDFGDFSPISTDFAPVKSFTSIGSFTVKLIANDTVHNCFDTITKNISVNEVPLALFAATNGCVNSALQFNNGSIPPIGQTLTFSWNFGDGSSASTTTSPAHVYTTPGTKNVILTATTNNGCSDDVTNPIVVTNVPAISFSWDSIDCNTRLFKPSIAGLNGYRWDFGDGTIANTAGNATNIYQFKNNINKPFYTVKLTVTSGNNCQAIDSQNIVIYCTVGTAEEFAAKFNLEVYPNPFEASSNISYNLDSRKDVKVTVIDILGRVVSETSETNQSAGSHTIKLDESKFNNASSIYMVRIQIGDEYTTKQLIKK